MLTWVPSALANDSDPCSGLDAYNAARPPESDALVAVCAALFYTCLFVGVAALATWWALRKERALRHKSLFVAAMTTAAVFLAYVVIALKRANVDATTHHPFMRCAVFAWLYVAIPCIMAAASISKLLTRVSLVRRQRAAGLIGLYKDIEEVALFNAAVDATKRRTWLQFAIEVARFSTGYDTDAKTEADAERKLRLSRGSVAGGSFLLFCTLFFLPAALACGLALGATPAYAGQCRGCDLTWELVIILALTICLAAPVRVYWLRRLHALLGEADSDDDLMREIRTYVPVTYATLVLAVVLLAVDPQGIDYNYVVPWEFFILVGFTFHWYVAVGKHVGRAVLARVRGRSAAIADGADVSSDVVKAQLAGGILRYLDVEPVMKAFESFAEQKLNVENVRFIREVSSFVFFFDERAPAWRRKRAEFLFKTYVKQGAILQVNLSSAHRTRIELAFASSAAPSAAPATSEASSTSSSLGNGTTTTTTTTTKTITKDLFDDALHEIVAMVNHDLFFDFVTSKKLEAALRHSGFSSSPTAALPKAFSSPRDSLGAKSMAVVPPAFEGASMSAML